MSRTLLPHALIDLTLARASARLELLALQSLPRRSLSSGRRHAHQSALVEEIPGQNHTPYDLYEDRSLYSRRRGSRQRTPALASGGLFPYIFDKPVTDLEKRVAELKEATESDEPGEQVETVPSYTDTDLLSIYADLLAAPPQHQPQEDVVLSPEEQQLADETALHGIVGSLYALETSSDIAAEPQAQYRAALEKVEEIVKALEGARGASGELVTVSILSEEEWLSLVRICLREQDSRSAEVALDLLKRSGSELPVSLLEEVMASYAGIGDVVNAERFLATYCESPPEPLRDLHIKAHVRALTPYEFPTTALQALHHYETLGLPAPQRSYTRLISKLLFIRSTVAHSQAWDLFSHMQYVAHPNPDSFLYATMIRACASRVLSPQPARALDLFTEMTVDRGIPPTTDAYNAAIFACACSGNKLYVGEAFRLAKEMIDGNRDAYGKPAFAPDRRTFCALLEGAKRIGDLAKVRWILAEIVAESMRAARGDVADAVVVDEEIMAHVFHAYASYQVPFIRSATVLVDREAASSTFADSQDSPTEEGSADLAAPDTQVEQPQVPVAPSTPQFSAILPQSRPEVLAEVHALFSRITAPPQSPDAEALGPTPQEAFKHVSLVPRLLNAYLSVHYTHAPFEDGVDLYNTVFAETSVAKNMWSYVEALEFAACAERKTRKLAVTFARRVWEEWRGVEESWRRKDADALPLNARLIERAYVAMIRILSLSGHLTEAQQVLRQFFQTYPPRAVKQTNPRPELRSTRILLTGARPLVRLTTPVEIPDDTVPPLLSFPELQTLHNKLVDAGDKSGIAYVKYVCVSYRGALRRRKEAVLSARPVGDSEVVEDASAEENPADVD